MRAVFSAMRRSFASMATDLASSSCGARKASRFVSRTGIQPSRKLSLGIDSRRVMTRAPVAARDCAEKRRGGAGPPASPSWSLLRAPAGLEFGEPADLDFVHRLLGRSLRHRKYGYEFAAFIFGSELNLSIDQREQRVILAH